MDCDALQHFDWDHPHLFVYTEVNELMLAGFPPEFLLPLTKIWRTDESTTYVFKRAPVKALIGIRHLDLVLATAEYLNLPKEIGTQFTGRGFVMNAKIEAIRAELFRLAQTHR